MIMAYNNAALHSQTAESSVAYPYYETEPGIYDNGSNFLGANVPGSVPGSRDRASFSCVNPAYDQSFGDDTRRHNDTRGYAVPEDARAPAIPEPGIYTFTTPPATNGNQLNLDQHA